MDGADCFHMTHAGVRHVKTVVTIQTQDTMFQVLQPRSEFKSLGPTTFPTSRRAE